MSRTTESLSIKGPLYNIFGSGVSGVGFLSPGILAFIEEPCFFGEIVIATKPVPIASDALFRGNPVAGHW